MSVRHISRETAVAALRSAARSLAVLPADLTVADYRAVRRQNGFGERLPSDLSIRLLYGNWRRACDDAATPWRRGADQTVRSQLFAHPRRPHRP